MILSRSEKARLINLQKMVYKRSDSLPIDDLEGVALYSISAAIAYYLERFS